MTLRLLVVDDTDGREKHLRGALALAGDAGSSVPLADGSEVVRIADLGALRDLGAGELASFDAVLIDFALESEKVPGFESWGPVTVEAPDGTIVAFVPKTGMGALLLLRSMIESAAYREARVRWRTEPVVAWNNPDGSTRLFSFVKPVDWQSRLFAAAAWHWFEAPSLNAQLDLHELASQVADPARIPGAVPSAPSSRGLVRLGAALHDAMEADPVGGAEFLDAGGRRPSGLEWYRIYLAHEGKSLFGPEALREAAFAVSRVHVNTDKLRTSSYKKVMDRLQRQLNDVVNVLEPRTEWHEWQLRERPDPMYRFLRESRTFWNAADVAAAYTLNVAREREELER